MREFSFDELKDKLFTAEYHRDNYLAQRDTYRRQRDELVEAAKELVRQHMNVRAAEGYPTDHSEATIAVDKIIHSIEQEDAK